MYDNGALLRLKYQHLFPENGFFRLNNMQIMSSVPERTMMSLQSFMAGFFPPPLLDTSLPIWWQPFFTTVDHEGKVVYMNLEGCPRYIQELMVFLAYPPAQIVAWIEEDRAALDELSAIAGVPLDNFMEIMGFGEVIKAQIYIDPKTPQWAIDAYYDILKKYVEASFALMHGNAIMIKIRGGPLITEIVDNFGAVASNAGDGRPIMIYSAHDMTVLSLAYVLGVEAQVPALPNYSDTFLVDLLDNGDVQVIYMNTERTLPTRTVMNVPGCGTQCPLSTFRLAVGDKLITGDWKTLCAV